MNSRRSFIKKASSLASTFAFTPEINSFATQFIKEAEADIKDLTPAEAARNEEYWHTIQQAYTVSPNIINLNNGGVSPQPLVVQDAIERYNRMSNEGPSYFMWRILDAGRESLRMKLADLAGCDVEELAINRNATEALGTVIFGLPLKKGDEVVLT